MSLALMLFAWYLVTGALLGLGLVYFINSNSEISEMVGDYNKRLINENLLQFIALSALFWLPTLITVLLEGGNDE